MCPWGSWNFHQRNKKRKCGGESAWSWRQDIKGILSHERRFIEREIRWLIDLWGGGGGGGGGGGSGPEYPLKQYFSVHFFCTFLLQKYCSMFDLILSGQLSPLLLLKNKCF